MGRWSRILARLVRPGGRYVLLEGHPMAWVLDDDGERVGHPYFGPPEGLRISDEGGTYADMSASTVNNETVEFFHTLSDVLQSLVDAGFVVERFVEHPFTVFELWPWLEKRPGQTSTWWAPEGRPSLPLMYSVVARRSA
jgi:hypothetical protein